MATDTRNDPAIILAALDLGLQAWRATPSRERFVEAVAALGRLRAGSISGRERAHGEKLREALEDALERSETELCAARADNEQLREIAEAAEDLIERTVVDLTEVGRREVRLSRLLRAWRAASLGEQG